MSRKKITEVVSSGKILISDGAWGTFLQKKVLQPGECPELWCIERPDDVKSIAQSYIEAGSDMVEANSFGGTCFKLEHYGLADKTSEINEAAARISREAAGENNWVIASIGPTGKILLMGDVTEEELYNAFKEQAVALEKGGADAVCIETMSAIDEAVIAIKAAKENTNLEVICTFTFEKTVNDDYRSMMGVSPTDMAKAVVEAGADIIGTNCGNGFERMIDIVKEIKAAVPEMPILVHANAGAPVNVNGVDTFPDTPEDMKSRIKDMVEAGANIIGGCCGTTPAHISAMKEGINEL
jgi:5-methyltetrahydrofolate--homocysteine methyltransferase